jgi:hypothetical protein
MKESPNLNYINKISKGNETFTAKLLEIIKKELSGEIETYHVNLITGDLKETAGIVHKLTHKIKILGLHNGQQVAEQYREELLLKNFKLKIDFENILSSMELFIKKV